MHCGNCTKTDGLCYTSNPPKVKCTVTGKFHGYGDECDCDVVQPGLVTDCIVCGEPIQIFSYQSPVKICDKCKAAIRYVRDNFMEE